MQMNKAWRITGWIQAVLSGVGRFPDTARQEEDGRGQQDDESFKFRAPFSRRGDGFRRAD